MARRGARDPRSTESVTSFLQQVVGVPGNRATSNNAEGLAFDVSEGEICEPTGGGSKAREKFGLRRWLCEMGVFGDDEYGLVAGGVTDGEEKTAEDGEDDRSTETERVPANVVQFLIRNGSDFDDAYFFRFAELFDSDCTGTFDFSSVEVLLLYLVARCEETERSFLEKCGRRLLKLLGNRVETSSSEAGWTRDELWKVGKFMGITSKFWTSAMAAVEMPEAASQGADEPVSEKLVPTNRCQLLLDMIYPPGQQADVALAAWVGEAATSKSSRYAVSGPGTAPPGDNRCVLM